MLVDKSNCKTALDGRFANSVHYTLRRAMGRRTVLSVLIAFLLATTVSCRGTGRRVIGVVPKGMNSMFWRSVQAGVLAAGRDFDVEIQWNGPTKETDFSRQIQIVESMINGRVDGIVLSPTERIALVGVVERAADLGIPVTILDSKVETDRYVSFVATNNYEAGLSGARRGTPCPARKKSSVSFSLRPVHRPTAPGALRDRGRWRSPVALLCLSSALSPDGDLHLVGIPGPPL